MEQYKKGEPVEFVQAQIVVSVELKHPMQYGKRKVSHLEVTIEHDSSVKVVDDVLMVHTQQAGVSEHFPMANVVKWRIVSNLVPPLEGHEFGSYEYAAYTYPERLGGHLGSYSNKQGCLGFLDTDMQITMMEDLEA